jgi:hypothetical protein
MQITVRAASARKRRLAIAAVVALAVAVMAPMLAPSAGADIANAGDVSVSMHLSVFTPSFTIAGMSTTGAASATVSDRGLVSIPQSSLSFQPVDVQVNLSDSSDPSSTSPAVVSVQAVATSAFSGGLDPSNGSAFLVGNLELLWSQSPSMNNCPVGPFRVVVRSNAQGAISYSSSTGSVSMVDPNFAINPIPNPTSGCGGNENALNDALSLPVTTTTTQPGQPTPTTDPTKGPPVPAVVLSLSFNPAPRASVPAPIQHHPHPPATTGVTPTTETVTPTSSVVPPPVRSGSEPARRVQKSVSHKVRHPSEHHKTAPPKKKGLHITLKKPAKVRATHKGARKSGAKLAAGKKAAGRAKAKKAAKGSRQLSFVPASFVKRSPSALATGLNLAGLLGLLVFSSLALWLVTSELSDFKAGARRQRAHRIAGVTDRR